MHTHTHTHTHTCSRGQALRVMSIATHIKMHTTHTHTHTCIHKHTHTRIHTYTQTSTHPRTLTQPLRAMSMIRYGCEGLCLNELSAPVLFFFCDICLDNVFADAMARYSHARTRLPCIRMHTYAVCIRMQDFTYACVYVCIRMHALQAYALQAHADGSYVCIHTHNTCIT
jgi:hypothetical protein